MHIHARSKAEQSDVPQSEVSESIDSLNSFLNSFLERDYKCNFEYGFAPSCLRYSAASRLYVLAGERIQIRSQPRHNIDQLIITEKTFQTQVKIDLKSMKIGSWSHVGSR